LAIEKSGIMERVDEFPFGFEIISTDGEYVTARFKVNGSETKLENLPGISDYDFYTNAETVNELSSASERHTIRMEADREYTFEYSYGENGGKVYYNGIIKALSFEVNGEPYATVKIYDTVRNVLTSEYIDVLNGEKNVASITNPRGSGIVNESETNNSTSAANRTYDDYDNYGQISTLVDVDYWVVSFTSAGSANFWLSNSSSYGNLSMTVYDGNGNYISSTAINGSSSGLITYNVSAYVNYYIAVTLTSGNVPLSYWLRAKNTPSTPATNPDAYEPNNGIGAAIQIYPGTPISANIHNSSDVDYYKVILSGTVNMSVGLGSIPAGCDYDLYVYTPSVVVAGASTNSGIAAESVSLTGITGTYYIAVIPQNSSYSGSNYYLNVTTTAVTPPAPAGDSYEPNNSINLAKEISTGTAVSANIHEAGDVDHYKFNVTVLSNISITLTNIPSGCDYDIELRSPSSSLLGSSTNYAMTSESIGYPNAAAGWYYVAVIPKSNCYSADNYSLTVSLTAVPLGDVHEPNNTIATATDISQGVPMSGTIHIPNDVDYYKITLTSNSSLTVTLNNSLCQANNDLKLCLDDGTVIASSVNSGTANDSITIPLIASGTYYVKVYPATLTDVSVGSYSLTYQATTVDTDGPVYNFVVRDSVTGELISGSARLELCYPGWEDVFTFTGGFVARVVDSGQNMGYNVRKQGYMTKVSAIEYRNNQNKPEEVDLEPVPTKYLNTGFTAPLSDNPGYVSSHFGNRGYYYGSTPELDFHQGTDYGRIAGTSILSVCTITNGEEESFGNHYSMGNYVKIADGSGYTITYMHMQSPYVKLQEGEQLDQGEEIGKVGGVSGSQGAGHSTGAHLHIDIYDEYLEQYVDPEIIFGLCSAH